MLPIYDVVLGELTAMSLVEHPAVEEEFQMFSEKKEIKLSYNEEKHIIFGPALIADKLIYREDSFGRGYYLVFKADIIEKLFQQFMKDGISKFNLEHSEGINDVYLLESFIKRPGLNPIGFEEVSDGSWFISLKVENESVWEQIKQGKYNGFSIEALIKLEPEDELDKLVNQILNER